MEPEEFDYSKTLESMHNLKEDCDLAFQKRKNLPFNDLKLLAKKAGFIFTHDGGSHQAGRHPTHITLNPKSAQITIQSNSGKAMPYQVKLVIEFIRIAQPKKGNK